jgi:hypothetical protein
VANGSDQLGGALLAQQGDSQLGGGRPIELRQERRHGKPI